VRLAGRDDRQPGKGQGREGSEKATLAITRVMMPRVAILSAALLGVFPVYPSIRLSAQSLRVPYHSFTLPNGLQVLLHEDHSVPLVTVKIWYHVRSAHAKRGRTGFAPRFDP